jgi:hypothetical protein
MNPQREGATFEDSYSLLSPGYTGSEKEQRLLVWDAARPSIQRKLGKCIVLTPHGLGFGFKSLSSSGARAWQYVLHVILRSRRQRSTRLPKEADK